MTRRSIAIWAVLGVLLHAGLVVRHNAMALGAHLLHQELVTALGNICNSGGVLLAASEDVPIVPSPNGGSGDCPICTGLIAGAGVLPTAAELPAPIDGPSARVAVISERIAPRLAHAWPPPRGPPQTV